MNLCGVCGAGGSSVCDVCLETVDGAAQYAPENLILVCDASCVPHQFTSDMRAGGGIILARRDDERVLSICPVEFYGDNSLECELEVIERAIMLAPGVTVWCDNRDAINRANSRRLSTRFSNSALVQWLPFEWRNPLHNLSHKVANIARLRDWEQFNNLGVHHPRRRAA